MFKCFRQIEHSDCGLTCIRMIAKSYGKRIPLKYLHSISDLNRLGMSIKDIKACLNNIGMDATAVQIRNEHIANMPLPAILYWQQRHFVVLYKYNHKKGKYSIADPAQGKIIYGKSDFLKYWMPEGKDTGLAILAEPNELFYEKEYEKENTFREFCSYLIQFFNPYKASFFLALLITLIIMAADFAIPLLLKQTVDEGIALNDLNLIITLLLSQLSITIGGLVAANGMNFILTKIGLSINLVHPTFRVIV